MNLKSDILHNFYEKALGTSKLFKKIIYINEKKLIIQSFVRFIYIQIYSNFYA